MNSIVVLNRDSQTSVEAAQFSLSAATPVLIDYCCVEGWTGLLAGTGSFNADPRFRDPAGADGVVGTADDDWHLLPDSPCIDTGDPARVPPSDEVDLDRLPRIADGDADGVARIDIGADEFGAARVGDANCDQLISFDDIAAFVTALVSADAYAAAFPTCDFRTADISGDGAVAFDDIDVFVACLVHGGCR